MSQSNPNYSYDTITITSLGDDNLQQDLFKISDLDDNMSINLSDITYQSNITASSATLGSGTYSIGGNGGLGGYTFTTPNTGTPSWTTPIGIGGGGGGVLTGINSIGGNGGLGGYTFTSPNTGTPSWTTPIGIGGGGGGVLTGITDTINWGTLNSNPGLKVNGDAEFEGDLRVKGKSITEMFDKIEERLAILHPNPELEEKWDELKELGKRYKELEQEIIEKEKVWAILKK